MPSTNTKSSAIRVNVTPALHAELERIANLHDVSVAHVVRRAIRAYLMEHPDLD
jgi:hypothetical protein